MVMHMHAIYFNKVIKENIDNSIACYEFNECNFKIYTCLA